MKHVRADNLVQVTPTFRYHAPGLSLYFSSDNRRRWLSSLPIPRILHERRSLVARLLLVTRSHVHTLLYRVLLVTAPTKDPSIFPQSRRKFLLRARLAYISHCTGCAFCVPGTIIASYIKSPIHTRDKAFLLSDAPAFNEMLVVSFRATSHFVNFKQRTRSSSSCFWWDMHCRPEEFMPVARR